jgi:hypothetical protein
LAWLGEGDRPAVQNTVDVREWFRLLKIVEVQQALAE